jgi:ATP-dependent helicase HepA
MAIRLPAILVSRLTEVASATTMRWCAAHASAAHMPFALNDQVQSANDPSRVGIIRELGPLHAGQQYYLVFWGDGRGTRMVGELDLRPHAAIRSARESLIEGAFGGYPEFQRLMTLQRLIRDQPLRNNIYAFNASRTQFYPYQFKPLLKFLDSAAHRLLICDEVGLGKTIEAGLILLELKARQTTRLILIVCPSNLRQKWRIELKQRFGEEFRVLQARELRQFLDDYEKAPDRTTLSGIVSLETIRTERVRARLDELSIPFDLVIVDEAHYLRNFGTSQRDAVQLLAQAAQAMVMLTATPVHLGQENLFSLLNLLDDEDFPDRESAARRFADNEWIVRAQSAVARREPDLEGAAAFLGRAAVSPWLVRRAMLDAVQQKIGVLQDTARDARGLDRRLVLDLQRDLAELNLLGHILTRTRKRDVHEHVPTRRPHAVELTFSPVEQDFYDTVTALIHKENEGRGQTSVISQWRLNTPQRRMASSIQGMVEFYREGERDGASKDDDPDGLDFTEDGTGLDEATEGELRGRLQRLIRSWPVDGPDTKYDQLRRVIHELEGSNRVRKVLVFATFKHTIRYLERRLRADGVRVAAISGDTPQDARPRIIERFRDPDDIQVLLSSRVGSEGLDFQFCSTLVNYDLPWNPMEVEQRIGRLDRIGQEAPSIVIVNLWSKGTIEERILRRLYDRIGIFERSIGDLEAILGDVTTYLQEHLLRAAGLTPEEAEEAAERAAHAIDRRRHEIERLEATAASFVGVDAFFEEEVAAIKARRRYVTGPQLHRFLADFLRNEAPRTRLEYDFETNTGILSPDDQLRSFLRSSGRIGDMLTVAGAVGGSVAITFDSQVAFQKPRIEFLSVAHPLILAIADFYQGEPPPLAAQHVALASDRLPQGFYFFVVYRLRVQAARAFNSLEAVFLREDLGEACDAGDAEALLGEIVERGETASAPIVLPRDLAKRAMHGAEQVFLDRMGLMRQAETVSNEAFVDQRLASLRTFYRRNIEKKRQLLTRAVVQDRQEQYLRMLKGHLTRLEGELHHREQELERLRTVTLESDDIAAGVLEVVPTEHGRRARKGTRAR